jgi:hypothetical protein
MKMQLLRTTILAVLCAVTVLTVPVQATDHPIIPTITALPAAALTNPAPAAQQHGTDIAASFEQLTIGATAVGLSTSTIRPGGNGREVKYCKGMLEGGDVRYREDGGADPTASVGHLVRAGAEITVSGADNIRRLKFIRKDAGNGTLPLTCYF